MATHLCLMVFYFAVVYNTCTINVAQVDLCSCVKFCEIRCRCLNIQLGIKKRKQLYPGVERTVAAVQEGGPSVVQEGGPLACSSWVGAEMAWGACLAAVVGALVVLKYKNTEAMEIRLATSTTSVKVATIDCLVESRLLLFNYLVNRDATTTTKNCWDYLLGDPIVSLTTIHAT